MRWRFCWGTANGIRYDEHAIVRIFAEPVGAWHSWYSLCYHCFAVGGVVAGMLHRLPESMVPPLAIWLDIVFNFIKDDLGLFTFTRWLSGGLEWLLDVSGNIFFGKRRWPNIGPMPWTALAAFVAIIGYYLGGWRMALLAGGTLVWTALIGQWKIAMETLSVLTVAAPLAFVIGLSLGIAAWKYPLFDRIIKPVLSVLQTLPFFTYLLPAVIFFKVGPTAGAVATTIYAIPPMILMMNPTLLLHAQRLRD